MWLRDVNVSKLLRIVLLGVCIAIILYLTIFSRTPGTRRVIKGLLWEIQEGLWRDIFLNILLFIPIGFLVGKPRGVLYGLLLSIFIELSQYIFGLGYCEADDVVHNAVGCLIGYLIWIGSSRMLLKKWEDLPDFMKCEEVKEYYKILEKRKFSLVLKRAFDLIVGSAMFIILAVPMAILAVWIKLDSPGPVFYRQERITSYGKHFKIHKFRTMVANADKIGTAVTVGNDSRITKVGAKLRDHRLDEFPQVFDVLSGNMSFVGTRPEAVKYVEKYKPEYLATLLLPAGITSEASIRYKDEAELLDAADDVDRVYVEDVLPGKMKYNLEAIKKFSFFGEIVTMFRTVFAVVGKEYE